MKKQNYSNHKRYYIPHHFIFLPLVIILTAIGVGNIYMDKVHRLEWIMFSVLSFCFVYLTLMIRQHYALGNQDRIVRLEFRLRHFELLGESSKKAEEKLSFNQIAALRFAEDNEFKILLDRAINENLSGDDIKKSIKNWKADYMRL